MSSKASNTWDAAADRELLLAVLSLQNVTVDCEGVAKYLSKDGKVYTASAIQNRVGRLKRMVKKGGYGAEDGEGTPKGSRKRGAGAIYDGGDSPTKKRKTPKKAAKTTSSDEDDEEAGKHSIKEDNGSGDELS